MNSENADRAAQRAMRHLGFNGQSFAWRYLRSHLQTGRSVWDWGFTPSAPQTLALVALAGVPMHFAVRAIVGIRAARRH